MFRNFGIIAKMIGVQLDSPEEPVRDRGLEVKAIAYSSQKSAVIPEA
jgi:hypothetical protein